MSDNNSITTTDGVSIMELLGYYPAALALLAIIIGVTSLILRKKEFNSLSAHLLGALALLGFGVTAWRIHEMNSILRLTGTLDYGMWINDLGYAWFASAIVMPSVAIGLILLGIASTLTQNKKE